METENNKTQQKVLRGKVVSTSMKDTAVILVDRFVRHPRYGKFTAKSKRHKVHDPGNTVLVGDIVEIKEISPVSKDKHFEIVGSVTKGEHLDTTEA